MEIQLTKEQIKELRDKKYIQINDDNDDSLIYVEFGDNDNVVYVDFNSIVDITKEEIEKVTPQLATRCKEYKKKQTYSCPTCESQFGNLKYDYCPFCGQKIKY